MYTPVHFTWNGTFLLLRIRRLVVISYCSMEYRYPGNCRKYTSAESLTFTSDSSQVCYLVTHTTSSSLYSSTLYLERYVPTTYIPSTENTFSSPNRRISMRHSDESCHGQLTMRDERYTRENKLKSYKIQGVEV